MTIEEGNGPPDALAAPVDEYYNPVFEKLKAQSGLTGAVAYALYKIAKREWIDEFRTINGRRPTEAEYRSHTATQTDTVLHGYVARADQAIAEYARNVVNDMRSEIVEDALRGTFWRSVWPSLVASLIFAGVLAILFLIAAVMGAGLPIEIAVPGPGQILN